MLFCIVLYDCFEGRGLYKPIKPVFTLEEAREETVNAFDGNLPKGFKAYAYIRGTAQVYEGA